METKKCKICRKIFIPARSTQVTCGRECSAENKKRLHTEIQRWKREKISPEKYNKICVVCGKKFNTHISTRITCSDTCRDARVKIRNAENALKRYRKTHNIYSTRKCIVCGKEFLSKGTAKICSSECRKINRKNKSKKSNESNCLFCGKLFEQEASEQYCSADCQERNHVSSLCTNFLCFRETRKPKISIGEINKKAREKGMSYGMYMAVYGESEVV